jgi:hypothetical protein
VKSATYWQRITANGGASNDLFSLKKKNNGYSTTLVLFLLFREMMMLLYRQFCETPKQTKWPLFFRKIAKRVPRNISRNHFIKKP